MSKVETMMVDQYTKIVGALDNLFKEMRVRTNEERWRLPGSQLGSGSCTNVPPDAAARQFGNLLLGGPAAGMLFHLIEKRGQQFPGSSTLSSCSYFRDNYGCILAELKLPDCIRWIDNPEELEKRFGINGYDLRTDTGWIVRRILGGDDLMEVNNLFIYQGRQPHPEKNNEFVEQAYQAITKMTQHVKKFPILHPDEVLQHQ